MLKMLSEAERAGMEVTEHALIEEPESRRRIERYGIGRVTTQPSLVIREESIV